MPPMGRVTVPSLSVRGGPATDYPDWGTALMDEVLWIYGQAVGEPLQRFNDIWYNVGRGYVYSSFLQPVVEVHNPVEDAGEEGFWGEITVPYVDSRAAPGWDRLVNGRLYCFSVFRVRETREIDGVGWYRLDSKRADRLVFWVPGDAVRRIPARELEPIRPHVQAKRVVIDLGQQWLTALEDGEPVLEQRISSGVRYLSRGAAVDYRTRPGSYTVTSKRPSSHMVGGTRGIDRYDLPGVPWATFFHYTGLAVHGTYWHNDFGRPRSHGCIHVPPYVARWLYRWTAPYPGQDESLLPVLRQSGTAIEVG